MTWQKNYFSSENQPWSRQVEKEVDNLKSNFRSAEVNNTTRDDQLASSFKQLSLTTAQAIEANNNALAAIQDVVDLASPGGPSINASNINAGTIDASVVTVTNLNASNITTGSLSASTISGGTLNANLMTVSNLSASSINTGTLNASIVAVTNLNASNITTGFLSADRISGGTIDASNISGVSISGVTITGSTITSTSGSKSVSMQNGRISFSNTGTSGYIEGATTDGMVLYSSDTVYISAPGGITGAFASFGEMSSGERLTTDTIRRQTNGQLNFTTTAGTTVAYIDTTSSGTTATQIYANGIISAQSFTTRSSRRFKTNITNYQKEFGSILDLQVVKYQFNPTALGILDDNGDEYPLGPIEVGLIAEDVAEAGFENIVNFNSLDPSVAEGIDYSKIGVFLIPEVKELRDRVNQLEERLAQIGQ